MHKLFGAVAALALLSAAAPAFAISANADAKANVIVPITVTKTADLVFGNILSGPAGNVVVDAAGGRTGSATLLAGVTPTAAHFNVTADTLGGSLYTLSYSSTALTHTNNTDTMALAISPSVTAAANKSGNLSIDIGGTLTVGSNQVAGVYTGSVTVSAIYN